MQTIKQGTSLREEVTLLQSFLKNLGFDILVDGDFGPVTNSFVRQFQAQHHLVADGIVGPKSWHVLHTLSPDFMQNIASRFLSEQQIESVAHDLGLELEVVKAVNEVESGGTGFIQDKPKILFEGHQFWRQLESRGKNPEDFARANPTILFEKWNRTFYKGGLAEYQRLDAARLIDNEAALESASWGAYQIMGYHWKRLGYASITEFVAQMGIDEGKHLEAFARYLQTFNLVKHLEEKNWLAFAKGYNGPGQMGYDLKLKRAYERHLHLAKTSQPSDETHAVPPAVDVVTDSPAIPSTTPIPNNRFENGTSNSDLITVPSSRFQVTIHHPNEAPR